MKINSLKVDLLCYKIQNTLYDFLVFQLTGFPLQMPYTDIQPVLDAVYSTGVHNCEDPEVEFALAVYMHPYPNSVVAVWVYVGRLVKKISY